MRRKRNMKRMFVLKDTILIKEAKKTEAHCVYWTVGAVV
jgi:hypothetical protein